MKIVVTGAAGFIGSNLAEKLALRGDNVVGVDNFPLDFINSNFAEIDPEKTYTLHCASGYRSLVAASIFQANGAKNVIDVRGGFADIKATDAPLTDYVCPTTLL